MTRYDLSAKNIYLVGCGGVGSWLLPALIKLLEGAESKPTIHLIDGDKLEAKNMDRQLFSPADIGSFKADALANLYIRQYPSIKSLPTFLTPSTEVADHSLFFGAADNHTARRTILQLVDRFGGKAIIGGNEYTDAEAYLYEPDWLGTPADPRIYYPDILTDTTNDPTGLAGCTGEAAVSSPQLVLSNYLAGGYMLHLFYFHYVERPKLERDIKPFWPVIHRSTFSRLSTELYGQLMAKKK